MMKHWLMYRSYEFQRLISRMCIFCHVVLNNFIGVFVCYMLCLIVVVFCDFNGRLITKNE